MSEPDESEHMREMFRRFESEMNVTSESKDSEDVIRKFRLWTGREVSYKQKQLMKKYARQQGIRIRIRKPIGISKRKGIPREKLKRSYCTQKRKGKIEKVKRIPKGQKGAGQYAGRW